MGAKRRQIEVGVKATVALITSRRTAMKASSGRIGWVRFVAAKRASDWGLRMSSLRSKPIRVPAPDETVNRESSDARLAADWLPSHNESVYTLLRSRSKSAASSARPNFPP